MELDENINLLYNYLYNKDYNKNLIENEKIILGKIGLNDIKYSLDLNNEEYTFIINNILNSNFKLNNIDDEHNIIQLNKYSDESFDTFIKLSFYKTQNDINNLNSPINNHLLFLYLLSSLVINNETPHILLSIFNIDMKLDDIKKMIFHNKKFENIQEKINNKLISNICCVQISENYFSLKLLSDYIKNNDINYKLLLFQIIYTLLKINNTYYGFKHNNLIIDNIYLYNNNDVINEVYSFMGTIYNIPNDFTIKISNFEDASIPKYYNDNNKTTNILSDIITFSKDLLKYKNNIDNDTNEFIKSINDYNDYKELLDSDYFKIYHNTDNKISNKKISTNIIMHTRKIKKDSNNKANTNIRYIKQFGGKIGSAVSKNTFVVIIKDL